MRRFRVILEKDADEDMYEATVPALPGCVAQGRTKEQALERIREAVEVTLEGFAAIGKPVVVRDIDISLEDIEIAA